MSNHFYIILTSDSGKTRRLSIDRKILTVISGMVLLTLVALVVSSSLTLGLFATNRHHAKQIGHLREQLRHSTQLLARQQQSSEQMKQQMSLEIANLEMDKARQAASFSEEKNEIIASTVSELNARSEHLKEVMDSLGLKIKRSSYARQDSGGPFVPSDNSEHDQLLVTTEKYLETVRYTPLGKPVPGPISSRFGSRLDPVNNEGAYHTGLDFRAGKGDKVFATGAGVVVMASRNGNYGNNVQVDHGNGYVSSFAHLDRFLVKKGDRVERGQVIGLVGSTGRTTGAHLHYEISLNNKTINPEKLMQVAGITLPGPRPSTRN
ncbi:peptidoglycan DD-metalloendopeptidase family protein [Desulfoprunum benzoelyticum]|uniref:Murein DD-endopeptidase MepM/ murein hydrolase activator NlpD n=1 Tax=Desulfoprunum benzoelyticum TaxID=1506996 RepID=A0A840UR84_9BACT|nr:M23 family metallopeptidase [Desulfoprunum benzoelyticum]MBB5347336.1 murein DD-endopeptidase MepM/ murein hydrolase activator NlpD [Desulfoprunum benzoelyticum]MBM9530751.1 peptidoglycan DD-metalloendopeptidase family protein [Desulfoprunum benzoelyticum]